MNTNKFIAPASQPPRGQYAKGMVTVLIATGSVSHSKKKNIMILLLLKSESLCQSPFRFVLSVERKTLTQ